MNKKKYYKVVYLNPDTGELQSCMARHGKNVFPYVCTYAENDTWTVAPLIDNNPSKLFVFDDLKKARDYINGYNHGYQLWECDVKNPSKNAVSGAGYFDSIRCYWQLYNKFRRSKKSARKITACISNNLATAWMKGVLVDAVKLTKQIQ